MTYIFIFGKTMFRSLFTSVAVLGISASAAAAQKWASTRRDLWAAMFDPVAAFTSADAERQATRAEDSVFALDSSGGTGQNLLTRTLSRASSTVYYVLCTKYYVSCMRQRPRTHKHTHTHTHTHTSSR